MNTQDERQAFITWATRNQYDVSEIDTVYGVLFKRQSTENAWMGWVSSAKAKDEKLEGCVVVNSESLLLHAQSIRMFNDGDWENYSDEIEEHVCAIEKLVEAARGGNE